MGRVRYKPNSSGIRRLLNSRAAERAVTEQAERVEAAAQASVPVRTGRLRNSIHIEIDRTDRVVARVGSDLRYTLPTEAERGFLAKALGNR